MKRFTSIIFTLTVLFTTSSNAQVVLNEIYAEPGSGNQEFFELYNINTSNTSETVDNYTVISYFDEGGKKGFYVLDLPNLFIPSKGYFVASSAIPFNYQGNNNSTASNISWNDPTLVSNYGYIKKWVATGNTAVDGNRNYDEEVLPANFNDFFSKRSGGGASYNAFVFKNGGFVNSFFGGTGGATSMPSFITSMPVFKLETVTAATTKTSTINFNSIKNKQIEYVIQDIGSDNGFIKTKDGFCGAWTKSSADAFHTPGVTNSASSTGNTGSLTIETHLYNGPTLLDPAFVVYNIIAGPTASFPVELQVYLDNGSISGQLDMNDEFVELNTENALTDGPFTTYLPKNKNVLIIAKTGAGCIDQIQFIKNSLVDAITLPIKLLSFGGNTTTDQNLLNWNVDANETGDYFEVQKSFDGKSFSTVTLIINSNKRGTEQYHFKEKSSEAALYYRLKIINKNKTVDYSKTLFLKRTTATEVSSLRLLQNPVEAAIKIEYHSNIEGTSIIRLYNSIGVIVHTTKMSIHKGYNVLSIDGSRMMSGTYILEATSNNTRNTIKLIKNRS